MIVGRRPSSSEVNNGWSFSIMEEGEGEWDLCETRGHAPVLIGIMPYVDVGIMPLFWSGSSPMNDRDQAL